MAHDHPEGEQPTPEQEVELARDALADGDPGHAAHHIGLAIGDRPTDPEFLALIDELAQSVEGDPLDAVPLQEGMYFGTVAVRAYLLARAGQYDRAIDLLCQVLVVVPERPFLDWVETWIDLPGVAEQLDTDALAQSFDRCLNGVARSPAGHVFHDELQERVLGLVRMLRATRPVGGYLGYVHAVRARRAGEQEESEQVARELNESEPTYLTAIALAGALREGGKPDEAVEAFRAALEHDPTDVAARLDIGDTLLEAGLIERALAAYEEALEHEPAQPWGEASACYLRYLLTGEDRWRDDLAKLTQHEPTNQRAFELLDNLLPYVLRLDPPSSAIVNGAAKALQKGFKLSNMGVSGLEPPSARLALDWITQLIDPESERLEVSVGEVPEPDPRLPSKPVEFLLWRYEGTDPNAALPAPAPAIEEAIERLAGSPYGLGAWSALAKEVASGLATTDAEDLLAAMVHRPAEPPEGLPPWVWLFRRQVAAALVLSHLDVGWEGSIRKRALESLLHGPLDWTTTAAILALTTLLDEEPGLLAEVLPQLLEMLERPESPIWHQCVETPLLHCLPRLEALDEASRSGLDAARLELLRELA